MTQNNNSNTTDSQNQEYTWYGFPWPVEKTSGGYLYKAYDLNVVKAALRQLLLTSPGERVMLPDYGVGLKELLFGQLTDLLFGDIRSKIAAAINTWEPRVVVNEITIEEDGENTVRVYINFSLKDDLEAVDALDMQLEVS